MGPHRLRVNVHISVWITLVKMLENAAAFRLVKFWRYLLKADANAIIRAAIESNIGNP